MSFEYIRGYYKVPVRPGDLVEYKTLNGVKVGTITGADQYVHVRFDGVKHSVNIHPADPGLKYLYGEAGEGVMNKIDAQQAELEQVAMAAAERIKAVVGEGAWYGTAMCQRQSNSKPLDMRMDSCKILYEILAAQRAAVLEEADEQTITAAIREADRVYEKVGGSTRHYILDCLLPIMKKHGLIVVRQQVQERRA